MFGFLKQFKKSRTTNVELKRLWNEQGYLVLKGAMAEDKIDRYNKDVQSLIANRADCGLDITLDVLEGERAGARCLIREADQSLLENAFKINDHYLESDTCLELAFDSELESVLGELLGQNPVVINSLTFDKGSQQPMHFDTYYMPPPTPNGMAVASICLENQSEKVGPVAFYPGSHKIPPFRFDHGGIHASQDQMQQATEYALREIDARGLEKTCFIGEKGDVFIWHAQLYHGGEPILDRNETRKSLVVHYWGEPDVPTEKVRKVSPTAGIFVRPHQSATCE